uniref:Uncharacterized protein n=2 Tax=Aegilops tauschii subsp. strangulata TaxID=200361 RepID=A0A452ZQE8_AEGTS
ITSPARTAPPASLPTAVLPLPSGRSPLWLYDARRPRNLPSPRSTSSCPSASPMAHGTCRRTRPSTISCVAGRTSLRAARHRIGPPVRLSYDAGLQLRPPPSPMVHDARRRPRPLASPMARGAPVRRPLLWLTAVAARCLEQRYRVALPRLHHIPHRCTAKT